MDSTTTTMATTAPGTSDIDDAIHLPITLVTGGALGLILLALTVRVIMGRQATKTSLGHGDSDMLLARVRAHANLIEYAPLVLILLGALELDDTNPMLLKIIAGLFVLGRVLHPIGMGRPVPNIPRAGGTVLTLLTVGVLSIMALLRVL